MSEKASGNVKLFFSNYGSISNSVMQLKDNYLKCKGKVMIRIGCPFTLNSVFLCNIFRRDMLKGWQIQCTHSEAFRCFILVVRSAHPFHFLFFYFFCIMG